MPRRRRDNPPDWPAIRADCEASLPLAKIAAKHATIEPTICRQAKAEGWQIPATGPDWAA